MITYLQGLLIEVEKLHSQKKDTANIVHTFISADKSSQVKRACLIDEDIDFGVQTYSVCYLAQYLIISKSTKGEKPFAFLLGCDFSTILSQSIEYRYITIYSVMSCFENETKIDIIRELTKGDMTVSQLSRKLHLSRSSIGRYVEDLVNEVAITRVKKQGQRSICV